MKVHPLLESDNDGSRPGPRLMRMPNVYSKMLEMPFQLDAYVRGFETPEALHFFLPPVTGVVQVRTVRIGTLVTKALVYAGDDDGSGDEMNLDKWRRCLPKETRPDLAVVWCVEGQHVVTVPKGSPNADANNSSKGAWRCCNGGCARRKTAEKFAS